MDPDSIVTGIKAAGVIAGSKKIGLGAIIAMTTTSEDLMKIWPLLAVLLVPLASGTYFIGKVSQQLEQLQEERNKDHDNLQKQFMSELTARDIKINLTYDRAILGKRYTLDRGENAEERIRILEMKSLEPSRFVAEGKHLSEMIEEISSRVYDLELKLRVDAGSSLQLSLDNDYLANDRSF